MKTDQIIYKCIVVCIFYLASFNGYSQKNIPAKLDSLRTDSVSYLSPMEYAFMFHEKTPWMIKGGIKSDNDLFLAFEGRVIGSFTASIELASDLNFPDYAKLSIEARYYYNLKSRSKNKKTPFNLSGNYLSAGTVIQSIQKFNEEINANGIFSNFKQSNKLNSDYYLKWGMQRRYLKHGFVDVGIKATYDTEVYGFNSDGFTLNTETALGIAFAKDKTTLDKNYLCSVTKCHEAEKSVFTSDISNLLKIEINQYSNSLVLNPEIAYEIKIKESVFSLKNTLNVGLSIYSPTNNSSFAGNLKYELETRYYYNLRNRILKGKTGNGLSANYISLGLFSSIGNELDAYYFDRNINYHNFLQPQFTVGFQRFVGDHFFYDIGFRYRPEGLKFIHSDNPYTIGYGQEFLLYNKVGLKF